MGQRRVSVWIPFLFLALSLKPLASVAQPEAPSHQATKKLVVAVMFAPPFSMQDEDGAWTGITVDLWKQIAEDLDLKYEFKKVDLKGLLAGLEDGTLDVGATGLGITAPREEKFDFSTPYLVANEAVAVNADQQPNLIQLFRRAFFNWSLLGLFLFIVLVMVGGGAILWMLEHKGNSDHYGGNTKKSFGRSVFWSIIVLSGHDLPHSIGWSTDSPTTSAARIFGMIWMAVGVLLVSLFTATAASQLTSKQLQGLVNDPQDLRHVKVGTVVNSVGQEFLDKGHYKYSLYSPGPVELLKGLSEHQIDAAVYNGPIMSYYARTAFVNKVAVLRFSLRQDFMAIPLRPGSALRKPINRALLKVVETKKWQTALAGYLGNE
jgi:polar amino acid transport system substrate-binding protein